jgi:nitrate/nitrite transporter NarK
VLALRPATGPMAERPPGGVPLASILRDRRLARLAVVFCASFGLSIVIGAWVAELLELHTDLTAGQAATVGALTLVLSIVSRPAGGWIVRARPDRTRAAIAGSLLAGAAGTVLLLTAASAAPAVAGGILVGIGAGIPFAPCIAAVTATRPDAPATAIGAVNGAAILLILVGTPLAGATFDLAGEGKIAFAAMAALWIAALAGLPRKQAA